MIALGVIVVACFLFRLPYQSVQEATLASGLLLAAMVFAFTLGGWTSIRSAVQWAREHKVVTGLEAVSVLTILGLALVGGQHPVPFAIAETILTYFFLHAFGAIGEWLIRRFKRQT